MARVSARPRPERERVLVPARQACPGCGGHMRLRYENRRTLVTLSGPVRLRLRIRRCEAPGCPRFHVPYRPEAKVGQSNLLTALDAGDHGLGRHAGPQLRDQLHPPHQLRHRPPPPP